LLFSGQALAIHPGGAKFGNPDYTFYVSGSNNFYLMTYISLLCSSDADLYRDDLDNNPGNNWKALYCTMNLDPGLGILSCKEVLMLLTQT
jgi:hypothetical protein